MPSETSSSLGASTTEDLRLRNYRASIQQKNDIELREIQNRHDDDIQRVTDTQAQQMGDLKRAYEVQISQEAEHLEEKLHQARLTTEQRVEAEKKAAESQLSKLKAVHQQRIEDYKKNAEEELLRLRKTAQANAELIHDRERKLARKEREKEGAQS